MDITLAAVIAGITTIVQTIGTVVVVRIQKGQLDAQKSEIDGLRASIKDQKDSIDTLRVQAEGQVSLTTQQEKVTEQLRKLIADISAGYEKKISLIETNEQLEKEGIQEELRRTQERLTSQLEGVSQLEIPAPLASTISQILEDGFTTKSEVAGLRTDLASLTAAIHASLPSARPLSIAAPTAEFKHELSASLGPHISSASVLSDFEKELMMQIINQVHDRLYTRSIRDILNKVILTQYMDMLASRLLELKVYPGVDYSKIRHDVGVREPLYFGILKAAADKIITS